MIASIIHTKYKEQRLEFLHNLHPKLQGFAFTASLLLQHHNAHCTLTSIHRSPSINKQCNGHPNSKHTYSPSEAIDIRTRYLNEILIKKLIDTATKTGLKAILEPNHLHIQTP